MTILERWAIGALAAVLGALMSFVVNQVFINTQRITVIEQREAAMEQQQAELKDDLREHRVLTERALRNTP